MTGVDGGEVLGGVHGSSGSGGGRSVRTCGVEDDSGRGSGVSLGTKDGSNESFTSLSNSWNKKILFQTMSTFSLQTDILLNNLSVFMNHDVL